ncbi:MAG: hypothetical protein A2X86_15105 [Bdellovibrionales bacterium GWA2_49_15]|nr:MAG: hypothetical protein A2X86_15105 [Bdellovibrionales bacterium GWA2_49_15]HAZ13328.1 hypothetical protein [Bdellovibrionales bacterium]
MLFCLIFGIICSGACTKKNVPVDKITMLKMAQDYDPTVKPILPKDLSSGVRCKTEGGENVYGEGCLAGFQVQVGPLDMEVIEFASEDQAKAEALRLNQYYFKNWVFDNVTNEPILEHFVKNAFNAQQAKR